MSERIFLLSIHDIEKATRCIFTYKLFALVENRMHVDGINKQRTTHRIE